MAKVIAFEIEINGVQQLITDQKSLKTAIQQTRDALKGATFGTEAYEELDATLAELEATQKAVQAQSRSLRRELEIETGDGSYRALNAELVDLRNTLRGLSAEERKIFGPDLVRRIQQLDKEVKDFDAQMGINVRNVGNYQSALQGLGALDLAALFTLPGAIEAGATLLREGVVAAFEFTDGIRAMQGQLQQFTGQTGAALDEATARTSAAAETFKQDQQEIAVAANAAAKQLGISYEDALTRIETGFITGSNAGGEFLDQTREYGTFFAEAFGEGEAAANALFNTIQRGADQGIFSDKAVDAVKEVTLRLREMPTATQDALEGIGLSAQEVQRQIAEEGIGAGIETVSKRLGELKADSPEVGAAIANIFGGPGEDAGLDFLISLQNIRQEQQANIEASNEYQQQQARTLRVNQEFARVQVEIANAIGGAGATISNLSTTIRTALLQALLSIIRGFTTFVELVRSVPRFLEENRTTILSLGAAVVAFNAHLIITNAQLLITNARTAASAAIQRGAAAATAVWTTVQRGLNAVMRANPIGLVITAISLLIAGITTAYRRSETFRATLDGLGAVAGEFFRVIKEAIGAFVQSFESLKKGDIKGALRSFAEGVVKANPITAIVAQGERLGDAFNRGYAQSLERSRAANAVDKVTQETEAAVDRQGSALAGLGEQAAGAADDVAGLTDQVNTLATSTKAAAVVTDNFAAGSIKALQAEVQKLREQIEAGDEEVVVAVTPKLVAAEKALQEAEEFRTKLRERLTAGTVAAAPLIDTKTILPDVDAVPVEKLVQNLEEVRTVRIEELRRQNLEAEEFGRQRQEIEQEIDRRIIETKLSRTKEGTAEYIELRQELTNKEIEIEESKAQRLLEIEETRAERVREIQEFIFTGIGTAIDSLTAASEARADREIAALERRYEREIELAEGNKEKQEALEEELDAKKKQIAQREFERQKKYRVAAALASLAEGVVNILSAPTTIPDPFGTLFKATRVFILTATTAQQIAAINQQAPPAARGIRIQAAEERKEASRSLQERSGTGLRGVRSILAERAAYGTAAVPAGIMRGVPLSVAAALESGEIVDGRIRGATHGDPAGGVRMVLHGRPVLAEHGEVVDVDEHGALVIINKRSAATFHHELRAMRGLQYLGKGADLERVNSYREFGIRYAAAGAVVKPAVASFVGAGPVGSASGAPVVVTVEMPDEMMDDLARRVGASVATGARVGTATGAADANRRLEREQRLRARTG